MARNIGEIKSEMAQEFMRNEQAAERYGFEPGAEFGDVFGAASVENILLYVWAVCAWTVERLVARHKKEVTAELEELIAHRPKWYRDKVLQFMEGKELEADRDTYDTEGMSESDVRAARVVKHAVATESRDASLLTIKVAGESGGERRPLTAEQERQLKAYIGEIKDAGVRVSLVNMEADTFGCTVDVYYNAMLEPGAVRTACVGAICDYIENLPFNGEYTNMALVDCLQEVEGVKIVELRGSTAQAANESTVTQINARLTPAAGYFRPGAITVNMKAYDEQG
ncbi:MAG: hypothetical protein K2L55_09150 [Muribaculaceae bacterium]|nr:hypothetical protein [Muribaculaceae bacterium]